MTLRAGTRLGPYEIVDLLGAGGMGAVYRARDPKLGREVAVKVLPDVVAFSPERRARFEREARAIAALSHPNVLTIFDYGTSEGHAYAVVELLEGETLRDRIAAGPIPLRKALDYGAQIAHGLAAAHAKGIVHRDLKPENVFVLPSGLVKVLDFGLARLVTDSYAADTEAPTTLRHTTPGTIMGTAGYMAPEQVQGQPADHRADIFALGCVLYEMITGTRAFRRATEFETMVAILKEEPPRLTRSDREIPLALDRIVRRCLEKNPAERFESANDLAFDLETALGDSTTSRGPAVIGPAPRRVAPVVAAALAAGTLALGLMAGVLVGRAGWPAGRSGEPSFTRLTYGRGIVRSARFAPDGKTIVYGAAWDGQPTRLFITRTETAESTPLRLPNGEILAVSSAGEMAVSMGHTYEGWMGQGTLARAPLLGGSARALLEPAREADWTPDGSALAVVRRVNGRERIEWPVGTMLYETGGYVSHLRFSPAGDRLAFADHPLFADDVGYVAVMDPNGARTRLTELWGAGLRSLAWGPDGKEIWFTASRTGENAVLRAVDLSGRQRYLLGGLTHMVIFDVARDGRLLLGRETYVRNVEALTAGAERLRDFSLAREGSVGRQITADGRTLLITDQYAKNYATYLRRVDEGAAVRLGEGEGMHLSPDGQWALAITPESPSRILLHPTGPGQTRQLPNPDGLVVENARWLPDGARIVFIARPERQRARGYVMDVAGGAPRPFTAEGIEPVRWWTMPLSHDGTRLVARGPDGGIYAYRVGSDARDSIPGLVDPDVPLEWSADGRVLYVGRHETGVWRVRALDVATGRQTPVRDVVPRNLEGLRISQILLSPDAQYFVHSYSRLLTDLYVVEGIK
jgi:dipeptidyl aminopeptidase/acylaminoacyl peptidase